jgi:hypothetical protein
MSANINNFQVTGCCQWVPYLPFSPTDVMQMQKLLQVQVSEVQESKYTWLVTCF